MLMMCRMSNTSFSTAPSTSGISPKDLCFPFFFRRLEQCVCFSGPGKKAIFLPSCTDSFYEQSNFLTEGLFLVTLVTLILVGLTLETQALFILTT